MRKLSTIKKLKLGKPGYFCQDLENQKIEKIYKLQ